MDRFLAGLRAAAEATRLRLLAICAHGEVAVSELTRILEQSQPRVSRHLKLLCDAGLLERHREGTWAFYRITDERGDGGGALARQIISMIPPGDSQLLRDREALEAIKRERADTAAAYFRANADRWDRIRALHVDEAEVERALVAAVATNPGGDLLDIGTGTGRILELLGRSVARGVGIDLSREMLAVARARLDTAGFDNCHVRRGDMYHLPVDDESFDTVTAHQVLHYADRPASAIAEAARALRPQGRLVIVDFAPHELEELRDEHAHRRLGFSDSEIVEWCAAAGLEAQPPLHLPGDPLTVTVWTARKPERAGADGDRPRSATAHGEAHSP